MAYSQNGWSASRYLTLDNSYIPGTLAKAVPGVRRGDVATVLFYVAGRFNREVQKLHVGWCWGYNYREVTAGRALSNHSSGTAIDLNAPLHGFGSNNTFSAAQEAAIHRILAACDGVVRWGGDYSGPKDEMHFEINASATAVARLATRIRTGVVLGAPVRPAPTPAPAPPPPPEDDVSADDVVIGMASLLDQMASRETPTGKNVANDLNAVLGPIIATQMATQLAPIIDTQVRLTLFHLVDEIANRSSSTGRPMSDDIAAIHAFLNPDPA